MRWSRPPGGFVSDLLLIRIEHSNDTNPPQKFGKRLRRLISFRYDQRQLGWPKMRTRPAEDNGDVGPVAAREKKGMQAIETRRGWRRRAGRGIISAPVSSIAPRSVLWHTKRGLCTGAVSLRRLYTCRRIDRS